MESVVKAKKVNKKVIKEYSLQINKNNTIWESIFVSNITIRDFVMKL